ncbi:LPP20 family lipoprotein [Sulfurimonas sp. HSL-1716]|uniref:LPP20 family lipoprotein n=1 Tax=Hydrocurvibacter sulfurireducens TaxID=3131937 RepID=UPI0031F81E3F
MKKLRMIALFLGLLIFASCNGASESLPQNTAAAAWINSPPGDTPAYYYGVGEGKTQTDAKNNALADISSRISVSVDSTFTSSLSASRLGDNEDVLSKVKQDVVTKAKEIEYSNVGIEESYDDGKRWHVLVKVNREDLARTYITKLKKVDERIMNEWEIFSSSTVFEKLKLSNKINAMLNETDNYFPIIKIIKPNFNDSRYLSRYKMYTKEIREAQNDLVFKIQSDENSKSLASLIRSELSLENFKFSDRAYNVLIKIRTHAVAKRIASANPQFAKMVWAFRTTTIEAYDKTGKRVSNAVVKTKSGSPDGFSDALQRTKKYEDIIAREGIISFITNGNQKK